MTDADLPDRLREVARFLASQGHTNAIYCIRAADEIEALRSGGKRAWRYYNRLRPVGLGTIPKGLEWRWVEQAGIEMHRPRNSDLPISRRPYGVYETDRPLTRQELYDYEISEAEAPPAKINGCDGALGRQDGQLRDDPIPSTPPPPVMGGSK